MLTPSVLNVKYLTKKAFFLLLTCWLLVSFAALAAMYNLWWQRERVLYLGKPVTQQRKIVFQRAGFPPSLVDKINFLDKQWSQAVRYSVQGTENSLSYIKYLLLPRIPATNTSYTLQVHGKDILYHPDKKDKNIRTKHPPDTNTPSGLFLSFILLVGWAGLIRKLWKEIPSWPESMALACFFLTLLALPVRFFLHSVEMAFSGAVVIGIVGWITIVFHFFRKPKQVRCSTWSTSFIKKRTGEQILIGLLVGVIFAAIFWSFIMSVVVVPDDWDAWAIWGSKARVLAQGSGPLHDVTKFGHPDYPLLWPTVWAFSGWLAGGWEECWSKGWGTLFLLFCVWEVVNIGKEQRNLTAGLLAGALLVSMPNIPLLASWSYAEAPLWLMMTCGLGCFLRWQNGTGKNGIVLIGLFAAAAAYTKNEGVLFAVLLGFLFLFTGQSRLRTTVLYALTYALTFMGCYLLWWYWTRIYYDLGSQATSGLLHVNTDALFRAVARIPPACEVIFKMWSDIRQWNIIGFGIIVALFYALFKPRQSKVQLFRLLLPVGMLVGYFVIILFHTDEIYWQVGTSWNRLTAQILPLLIVLLVLLYCPASIKPSGKVTS